MNVVQIQAYQRDTVIFTRIKLKFSHNTGGKNFTRPLVIMSEIYKERVILPKALVL